MQLIADLEQAIKQHEALYLNIKPRNFSRYVAFFDSQPLYTKGLNSPQLAIPKYRNHPLIQEARLRIQDPYKMLQHHHERGDTMLSQENYQWAKYDYRYWLSLMGKLDAIYNLLNSDDSNVRQTSRQATIQVLNNYGLALTQLGRPLDALLRFSKALEINPAAELSKDNLRACLEELAPTQKGDTSVNVLH